jgi:aminopeptidase N
MTCGILEEKPCLASLRAEYEAAFEEWALQVRSLQAIISSAPGAVVTETEARVAAAERAYRESRDRLMQSILSARGETNERGDNRSLSAAV